jgi:Flp pilus assembly protein TadD
MSSASPEECAVHQSFLRTGPETTLNAHTPMEGSVRIEPVLVAPHSVFPAPDLHPEITRRLQDWPRFATLAVRIDPPAEVNENSAVYAALADSLGTIATESGGVWFPWDSALYGCAFPEMDKQAAESMAQKIQTDLAQSRVETVSIGISEFPLFDCDPGEALGNACKALDHAAFFGPGRIVALDAVSLNISGDHLYQSGHLDAAIDEYHAALRLDPANANVHNSLGVCLAQKEDLSGARVAFETALRLDPNEAMAAYNQGVLCLLDEKPTEALTWFRQAYAVDTHTFEIPFQIGKLLTKQKAYDESIPFLEEAIALRAHSAPAHTLLGRCRASRGQTAQAIAAYQRAVKINPYDAAALSALGSLYDAKGENPEICVTFCRQSVALSPDNGLFRLRLARLYHKHNQLDRALVEYECATSLGCDARRQIADIQEQIEALNNGKQCCA